MTDSPAAVPPRRIRWSTVFLGVSMHLGCLAAPFYFSWSAVGVCFFLGFVSCCLGITLGWHRLLTHRSFQTFKPIEYLLTLTGCIAWQNGPIEWVGTHRLHHAHTDEHKDPHSPRDHHGHATNTTTFAGKVRAFVWSHIGWIFLDLPFNPADAARDLRRDPVHVFIDRLWWLPGLSLFPALYLVGEYAIGAGQGLPWMIWGNFVRTTMMYHATWLVNSASHVWGYRNFHTKDDSTNNWWVALITFGEGWHNNHHAQQNSAAHGMKWWEFDITWVIIRTMRKLRLSWAVIEPDVSKMA